jgi:hypothetical protein
MSNVSNTSDRAKLIEVNLSDDHIKFIIWLILMIERSGLSCDAHEKKFMIRHVSGLPLNEDVLDDVASAIRDESVRLNVPIEVQQLNGHIRLTICNTSEDED